MKQVGAFKGTVGIGLREVKLSDTEDYCFNKTFFNKTFIKYSTEPFNFTTNIEIRYFSSGCYYLEKENLTWSSDGVEILPDTNITHAHCKSYHLTEFAGGFIVLPAKIDFNEVFANADFMKNPTVYATVIALISLYLILSIIMFKMDKRDKKKIGLTIIDRNDEVCNKYYYEIKIYTGFRRDAETNSKVLYLKYFNTHNDLTIFVIVV